MSVVARERAVRRTQGRSGPGPDLSPAQLTLIVVGTATGTSSARYLVAWYAGLDADLMTALEGLTEEDVEQRRIVRSDFDVEFFSPLTRQQLDIYREALLIFYAKVSVYLRAMGRPPPGDWSDWIG